MAVWHGDAEYLGSFLERKADKIAELNDLSLAGIVSGEPVQRFIDRKRLLRVARRCGDFQFVPIDMFSSATELLGSCAAPDRRGFDAMAAEATAKKCARLA